MNRHERGLEFKVGAFVFAGLAMLGVLVVQFGRLGEGVKKYYPLSVRFNDASGLLKGSDVLLAGARIGKVAGGPRLVKEGNGVEVPLKIYDYIKVPTESKFTVGSSGLLGDRFVNVTMPPGERKSYIAPDSHIEGTREGGLDDITREGSGLVKDLRGTVVKLDTAIDRLNSETLSQTNMDNLKSSLAHLSETTNALSESSKKIGGVIDKADGAMGAIAKDAEDLQNAIADARKMLQSATQGKGLLPTLLSDKQLSDDFHALITNLRAHGVLFYRDSASKIDMNTRPQATPAKPRGERR